MPRDEKPRPSNPNRPGAIRVLIVDDDRELLSTLSELLVVWKMDPEPMDSAADAAEWLEHNTCDLVLLDIIMPGIDGITFLSQIRSRYPELPVVMITGQPSLERAILSMREGAVDFVVKPFNAADLRSSTKRALLRRRSRAARQSQGGSPARSEGAASRVIGESEAIKNLQAQIAQLVAADCDTILITGETGTGKEVLAREIHLQSSADESSYVAIACPSLPEQLLESELFGHIKGSFTGAESTRQGLFSLAEGGTLFLDEVADLSPHGQASLLRALESRAYRPIGADSELDLSSRVIAATNVPLHELVAANRFRRDLFYRLAVHQIDIPPLRERPEDILPLAKHFLALCREHRNVVPTGFAEDAQQLLLSHSYPGNARELRNIVERAAVVSTDDLIEKKDIQISAPTVPGPEQPLFEPRANEEARRLLEALARTKWNRKKASELLGMPYSTFRYKLKLYGID